MTSVTIDHVNTDQHGVRLVADFHAGRLTVEQLVQLALATGRVQGLYMSGIQLATEAGIVATFNSTRREICNEQ